MGRSGSGEGSIHKRARDGLYEAKYTVQTETGPKRKTVYAKTRKEAVTKLAEAPANRDKGIVFDSHGMTVAQYMTRWLEDSARGDLAPRTYHNYRLQIRRHIVPTFGSVKLDKLTAAHIQSLYARKLRDGLKPSSVRYIHTVLHRALEQAVRFNLIPFNPAAKVDPPKVRQEEITPLDSEKARRFLDAAKGDKYEALYVLSVTTGLRMGEALGLKWSDIELVFSEPKNASRRTIDLPQRALEALRSHRKIQAEERLRAGSEWQDNGLMFTTRKGTPLDAQNVVNRFFKPLLKLAGLPNIRWHDLRHTYATLLLARGTHPTYVQKSLGHASVQLTLDRYSH